MSKLYIVDDDIHTCKLLATISEPHFKNIETFSHAEPFLQKNLYENDTILLDLMMPDIDGVEVIRHMAKQAFCGNLILISGYDRGVLHSAEGLALDHGLKVLGNFTKPIRFTELTQLFKSNILETDHKKEIENIPVINELVELKAPFIPKAADFSEAIKNKQLVLYYQPQVSMKTKKLIGVEALVRWVHPEHGLIYPDRFILLAEQNNLIDRLTEEVVNLAIEQITIWQQQGISIKVSVNISAQNITSLLLPEQLKKLVKRHNIDPSMLVLEITESAIMSSSINSLDILTRLRLKGFQLSIDDFGTGYSSLSQLHKMPFTELKIDQSFVAKMTCNSESRAIVETCIMLAHKLDMEVVAEGIEDEGIWELLSELGCDIAQGYYIARPMPAEKLNDWQASY